MHAQYTNIPGCFWENLLCSVSSGNIFANSAPIFPREKLDGVSWRYK